MQEASSCGTEAPVFMPWRREECSWRWFRAEPTFSCPESSVRKAYLSPSISQEIYPRQKLVLWITILVTTDTGWIWTANLELKKVSYTKHQLFHTPPPLVSSLRVFKRKKKVLEFSTIRKIIGWLWSHAIGSISSASDAETVRQTLVKMKS